MESRGHRPKEDAMRCDCHVHIVGAPERYPQLPERTYLAGLAPLETLQSHGALRGISKFVVVQPSFYGDDNSMLLTALAALGTKGRGVAVIEPDRAEDAYLTRLHQGGVRGLRANLYSPLAGKPVGSMADTFKAIETIAQSKNWHVEVIAPIETLAENAPLVTRARVPIVIDHYGLYGSARPTDEVGRKLLGVLKQSHVWMKLSAPYRHDRGPMNIIPERDWVSACLDTAPDRCVWGSDWPHPPPHNTHQGAHIATPYRAFSYTELFDQFAAAIPSQSTLDRVMIENANRLYEFEV
jgi:predicted TIM-barrel fold metal-dependent hydrolase